MNYLWAGALLVLAIATSARAGFEEGAAAFDRGDYVAAVSEWMPLADAGNGGAQGRMGHLYAKGLGVGKDFVGAYMWYSLATFRIPEAEEHDSVLFERNQMAREMTHGQIVSAEQLAAEWVLSKSMAEVGGSIDELINQLGDDNPRKRNAAAQALSKLGPAATAAIPALDRGLRSDPRWTNREWYALDLARIGTAAVPALVRALRDKEARPEIGFSSLAAAEALQMMGPAARAAVPALIEALEDDYRDLGTAVGPEVAGEIRWQVVKTLESIGPAAADAVPAMVTFLKSVTHVARRGYAAGIILSIEPTSKYALEVLMNLIAHEDPRVRAGVATTFGAVRPAPAEVIPALKGLLNDKDPNVRAAAAKALQNLQQ